MIGPRLRRAAASLRDRIAGFVSSLRHSQTWYDTHLPLIPIPIPVRAEPSSHS